MKAVGEKGANEEREEDEKEVVVCFFRLRAVNSGPNCCWSSRICRCWSCSIWCCVWSEAVIGARAEEIIDARVDWRFDRTDETMAFTSADEVALFGLLRSGPDGGAGQARLPRDGNDESGSGNDDDDSGGGGVGNEEARW